MDDRPDQPPAAGPPSEVTPPPHDIATQAPAAPPSGPLLTSGWATAIIRAVIALVAAGVVAEAVAFLFYAVSDDASISAVDVGRIGGAILFGFHHVGFVIRPSGRLLGDLQGTGLPIAAAKFTAAVGLMGGTVLVLWLLVRGGRAVAEEGGGTTLMRGLHGAKVGIPYAIMTLIVAWAIRVTLPVGGGELSIHPSYVLAFVWPLGLGLGFGFLGGIRTGGPMAWPDTPWGRRIQGAVAGGSWMIVLALILAFAGLVLLAPFNPDATKAYFQPFDEGFGDGMSAIVGTLIVLPNMAAWVLFPSMGACLGVNGAVSSVGFSFCLLSYTAFPSASAFGAVQATGTVNLPSPPPEYFLFILVPIIAVVAGGIRAVRRSRATSRQEALLAGALAGVVYAALALVVAVLAGIVVKAGVGLQGGRVRFGPQLVPSTALALLWGVVGGALGALWEGRSLPKAVRPAPVAPPWSTEPMPAGQPGSAQTETGIQSPTPRTPQPEPPIVPPAPPFEP